MRKYLAIIVLAAVLSIVSAAHGADPVSVLKSDASFAEKESACRALSLNGGVDAVPALAALLTDEKLTHMARYALEPMPFPEAGAALRDALGKTSGKIKVGVINSLGIRKDAESVPELIKLLSDADVDVAQAASISLGAIGSSDGAKALEEAIAKPDVAPETCCVFCSSLCACAESFSAKGNGGEAAAAYDYLLTRPNLSRSARIAALRGAVVSRGVDGVSLLTEALASDDDAKFEAALRAAREIEDSPSVMQSVAAVLPNLAPERKILLLDVLAARGGEAAGAAALKEAQEGAEETRVAALKAIARMAYAPALDLLASLACSGEGDIAKTAGDSLSYFPGGAGNEKIRSMLESPDAAARRVAVELVGQGALDKPIATLVKMADSDADEAVRIAALKALQDNAGIDEMQALLAVLLKAQSAGELQSAEKTLGALCERQKRAPENFAIVKAEYGALPDGPSTDVTKQVASKLVGGLLSIEASNANFGDSAPGKVKKLRVDYTENGAPFSKTVNETEVLKLTVVAAPAPVVDAYCQTFADAQGDAKLSMLRLLSVCAAPKSFETVRAAAGQDGALKDAALRLLCEWPTQEAFPVLMDLAKNSPDETVKILALRGAVRLLGQNVLPQDQSLANYSELIASAQTPDAKKTVLGGLAALPSAGALELALAQFGDEAVRPEAVQAAIAISKTFGGAARVDGDFFNGTDLTGWVGALKYWRLEDGAIVGSSDAPIPSNEFAWSDVEVGDFYLAVDIMLDPPTANAGVQFRSKRIDDHGQALGYQADVGEGYWGQLYHEHGRGKLDSNNRAEAGVVPGQWNHYEILAIGPAIWTSINGKLGVACIDANGERSGKIAVQIHAGAPQTARYKILKLVHNPKVELESVPVETLISELKPQANP
jgi:HEAT repeat protein